jgi:hypothetical protein
MGRDRYIVIDHRGIVRYRTPATVRLGTSFDDLAIRSVITTSLDELKMALQADAQAAADMESGGDMTAVLAETAVPGSFALIGNYPNPFNANTEIRLQLAKAGPVALNIYDVQGRLVRGMWSGLLAAGAHQLSCDGRDEAGRAAATGIFLYRLQSVGLSKTRKMLLLR